MEVTSLELRRKVTRKLSKKKLKRTAEPTDYTGRKYDDYLEFVKANPCSPTTEMDTVYNHQEGPYIQTFIFEINHETGQIRTNIFYCDAQMPSQKPHVENNHVFIRDIIQKKKSLKDITQDNLDLMFSHINSVPRKSLGGKTPYEAFEFFYVKDTLNKLHIQKIKKDKVMFFKIMVNT